jgi:hypothetical protein
VWLGLDSGAWVGIGTAAGTLVLALATFWLAWKTSALASSSQKVADTSQREVGLMQSQVEAMQTQVEAMQAQSNAMKSQSETAQSSLHASVRPLIVEVPWGTPKEVAVDRPPWRWSPTSGSFKIDVSQVTLLKSAAQYDLIVPVRNVGTGVAVLTVILLEISDEAGSIFLDGHAAPPSVPSQETADLVFSIAKGENGWTELRKAVSQRAFLTASVHYCDLAGDQGSETRLRLAWRGGSRKKLRYVVVRTDMDLPDKPLGTPRRRRTDHQRY